MCLSVYSACYTSHFGSFVRYSVRRFKRRMPWPWKRPWRNVSCSKWKEKRRNPSKGRWWRANDDVNSEAHTGCFQPPVGYGIGWMRACVFCSHVVLPWRGLCYRHVISRLRIDLWENSVCSVLFINHWNFSLSFIQFYVFSMHISLVMMHLHYASRELPMTL